MQCQHLTEAKTRCCEQIVIVLKSRACSIMCLGPVAEIQRQCFVSVKQQEIKEQICLREFRNMMSVCPAETYDHRTVKKSHSP